jgi:hypothetical protein
VNPTITRYLTNWALNILAAPVLESLAVRERDIDTFNPRIALTLSAPHFVALFVVCYLTPKPTVLTHGNFRAISRLIIIKEL